MAEEHEKMEGDFKIVEPNLYDAVVPAYTVTNRKKYPLEYKTAHDEFERIVLIGEDLTYSTEFYFRLASLLIDKMEE